MGAVADIQKTQLMGLPYAYDDVIKPRYRFSIGVREPNSREKMQFGLTNLLRAIFTFGGKLELERVYEARMWDLNEMKMVWVEAIGGDVIEETDSDESGEPGREVNSFDVNAYADRVVVKGYCTELDIDKKKPCLLLRLNFSDLGIYVGKISR